MMKRNNDVNLDEILNTTHTIIIFFGADFCDGCKMVKPIIEELSIKNKNIDTYYIDTSLNSDLTYLLNVTSIPTTIIVKDKNIIDKAIGYRPLKYFEKIING